MTHRTTPTTRTVLSLLLLALVIPCACANRPRVGGLPPGLIEEETRRLVRAQALAAEAAALTEKEPERAKGLYIEAVGIYRELPAAWNNLGVLLMKDEQYLQAAEAFATAADLSPTDPRPIYNIGLLWDTRGYPRDARRFYERAIERDPSYLPALRGAVRADSVLNEGSDRTLERLERALMLETEPKWHEWMRLYKIRIESQPLYARPRN